MLRYLPATHFARHRSRSPEKIYSSCAHQPRYLLINTGNANAGTGSAGIEAARTSVLTVASAAGVDVSTVLPFSTGVIGEPLPVERLTQAVPAAFTALSAEGWAAAAEGILTTDTRPKAHSVRFSCDNQNYVVTGIAKGSGMIRPNMATMLAFIATDMAVEKTLLQALLAQLTDRSFNRITVDGDTSTNDACVLLATGEAGNTPVNDVHCDLYHALHDAVEEVVHQSCPQHRAGWGGREQICDGSDQRWSQRSRVSGGRVYYRSFAVGEDGTVCQ